MGPSCWPTSVPRSSWSSRPAGTRPAGCRRVWGGSTLVASASAGILITIGDPDRPPVVPGGDALLSYAVASLNAAAGALIALRARDRTRRGQLVDVSVQEALIAIAAE